MQASARTAGTTGPHGVTPTGESALTGAPVARRLYREVAGAPEGPLFLEVIGAGGSGKTVLLDVLERRWTESGVPVARALRDGAVPETLLVDDAHLLPDDVLTALTAAVREGRAQRLVVARRPHPRPAALAELGELLARRRAPAVLTDLDRAGVAGRAALALDARPPATLVDAVLAWTTGSPALVSQLLEALGEAGTLTAVRPSDPPLPGLVERLGYQLERLPEPVRRFALALAVGAPLDPDVLVPALDLTATEVSELVEQASAAGLLTLTERGGLRPLYARALLRVTPRVRLLAQRRRLAEAQLERGASVRSAAVGLLGSEVTGARAAEVFRAAADEVLRDGGPDPDPDALRNGAQSKATCGPDPDPDALRSGAQSRATSGPALAGRLLDAAVAAGAPGVELAARRAEAAARAGDLDRALEFADHVLADPGAVGDADRSRAVTVAAAALAQRGLLARSAELYRWLGAAGGWSRMGANAVVAVPALIGVGALAEARELLEPAAVPGAPPRAPTLLAGAEELLARGVYDSVAGSPTAAMSQLARAAALLEPRAATVLLPDTPAALAALVAAHCGELEVAASVLERAVATGLGGPVAAPRHRLLQGWVLMSRGATVAARAVLAEVDAAAAARGRRLEPRDELVAAALEVGLARRAGDLATLMPAWGRAREAIVRHPVDLYVLQPLGELIVAAARLREQSWVRPHVDEAHALLARLGEPVLWSASVHWAELHSALTAEQWDAAAGHAEALHRGAGSGRYVAALAAAAPHWIAVLRGEVDPVGVEAAARGLHAVGLSWEGGKLAGQAAIRTTDRKAMSALLGCARGLQSSAQAGHGVGTAGGTAAGPGGGGSGAGPGSGPGGGTGRAAGPGAGTGPGGDAGAGTGPGGGPGPAAGLAAGAGRGAGPNGTVNAAGGARAAGPAASFRAPGSGPGGAPSSPAAPRRPAASSPGGPTPDGTLSDREREVAALVLSGMTYKEIGERLFISAKTVEHHVARMRQRLGANSRGDLLAHLRMILNP